MSDTPSTFRGYVRQNGTVGTRNLVGVIYTVDCARIVSQTIASSIPNGTAVGWYSCYSSEDRNDINTLVGIGSNPNIGAALVIGLGCQHISPSEVAKEIAKTGKPTEAFSIQGIGGTRRTIEKGTRTARKMSQDLLRLSRAEADISKLSVGFKSNVDGRSSKIPSFLFQSLATNFVKGHKGVMLTNHRTFETLVANDSSNFEAQSIGPGVRPSGSGLYIVDGLVTRNTRYFGLENEGGELTDFASAGAQIILHQTETGFGIGNVVSPTITFAVADKLHRDDIDLEIDGPFKSKEKQEEVKSKLIRSVADTASGKLTKSELIGRNVDGGIIFGGRPLLRVPDQICE